MTLQTWIDLTHIMATDGLEGADSKSGPGILGLGSLITQDQCQSGLATPNFQVCNVKKGSTCYLSM
jgi:hypothetical protein